MQSLILDGVARAGGRTDRWVQDRVWPYFRSPGTVIEPGKPLPAGLNLLNGSLEMCAKSGKARILVVGRDGQTLVRAAVARPADCHVVVVWGENLPYYQPWVYVDGKNMSWDERSRAAGKEEKPEVWDRSPPALVKVEGEIDELRAYPYAMTGPELANAFARASGGPMSPLSPLDVRFDYRLTLGRLSVLLDAKAHYGEAARARVDFRRGQDDAKTEITALPNGAGAARFDVGELPPAKYPLTVALLDRAGQTLEEENVEFERIDLPWLHNTLGLSERVYPPFTPVQVEGNKVSCVLRQYGISEDGLPESIVVGGDEILASPVTLELGVGGKAIELKPRGQATFGKTVQSGASWHGAAEGGGVTVTSDAKFEFDGMIRYELTVAPIEAPATIDSLALAVPLKTLYAGKIHVLPIGGDFRAYEVSRQLPSKEGVIWESQTGFPGGNEKLTIGSFVPMVWLGGSVRGLCYFADNDRGWVAERSPLGRDHYPRPRHNHASLALHQRTLSTRMSATNRLGTGGDADEASASGLPGLEPR